MKLKLDDVRAAFAVVDNVKPSPVADSSLFIRLRPNGNKLSMSATGTLWAGAEAVAQDVGGKWIAWVDRRVLKPFLDTAKGPDIEFFYKDELIIKSGQRLEVALHTPISGYESWNPKSSFDLPDEQKTLLATLNKYLPIQAGTENVAAVWFAKEYGIVSTDTIVIAASLVACDKDFFLPPEVAELVTGSAKLAVDKTGVGAKIGPGFVYQPLSSELDNYPKDAIKDQIKIGLDAPAAFKVSASILKELLSIANQFLIEKNEVLIIEPTKSGFNAKVDLAVGKFQRSVTCKCSLTDLTRWPVKRLLPWMEYAGADEVEFAKPQDSGAFRFERDGFKHVLMFADL
jgi:hypothetical protein